MSPFSDGPTWISDTTSRTHVMHVLKAGVRHLPEPLGFYSTEQLELRRLLEPMMYELTTMVLADRIDETEIREQRSETVYFPRFATWWDHFKATYRGRWWMRWRRWQVRFVAEDVTVTAKVVVDLTRYHTYPQANIVPPEFGRPVRWTETVRRNPYGEKP